VDEIEIMRSDHTTGSKLSVFSKQLLADSLTPQTLPPDRSYSRVIDKFCPPVGLTQAKIPKYIVQEPTHENIRAAWDLTQMSDLDGFQKSLNCKKFGKLSMNLIMATVSTLFCWDIAYHRKEVSLRGVSVSAEFQ